MPTSSQVRRRKPGEYRSQGGAKERFTNGTYFANRAEIFSCGEQIGPRLLMCWKLLIRRPNRW